MCKAEGGGFRRSSKGVDFGGTIVVDFGYHHLELWANHEQDESAMDGEREILHKSVPLLQPALDLTPIKVCGLFISQHDFY